MAKREYDLGAAELDALRVLWNEGPTTVRRVMNALHERGRRVAYTTVQTTLTRLEQKGVVRSDRSGVAFVYRPAVSRERMRQSRLRSLVDQLYDGAPGPLVLQLVRSQRLSREEIEQLHELIDGLDKDAPA